MKTAISLPDTLFKLATKTAKNLGISRSTLFQKALEEYFYNHNPGEITNQLNEIYEEYNSSIDNDILEAQLYTIDKEEW